MKSYIKIIFVLCISSCFSQEYRPFPSDSAVWKYSCFGYQSCCYVKQYQYFTDTLVNYHILKVAQKNYSFDDEGDCMMPQGNYYTILSEYYLREDIVEKKVYLYDNLTSTDRLLYDFNLVVGDTLQESYSVPPEGVTKIFVTGIDSVIVGTNYHKRYQFDDEYTILSGSSESTYLIEGIGYITDLLHTGGWYGELTFNLNCFSVNEISLYPYYNPNELSCRFFGADVSIKENENLKLNFYPNPINDFTSEINFSYSSRNDSNLKVEIRDMNGKIIDQKKVKINQDNKSFEINSCSNGVYQVYLFVLK